MAYRDHPPQDRSFVTHTFQFTSDIDEIQRNVNWMSADGGGDAPESVACGLYEVDFPFFFLFPFHSFFHFPFFLNPFFFPLLLCIHESEKRTS